MLECTKTQLSLAQQVVDKAQPSPALPVFMSGLSMGGMTAILTALRDKSKWKVRSGIASRLPTDCCIVSATEAFALQGIICLSPAVDCPRTVTLRIMSAIQGLILLLAPNSRVVPQPQIPNITLNEQEVCALFYSGHPCLTPVNRSLFDRLVFAAEKELGS